MIFFSSFNLRAAIHEQGQFLTERIDRDDWLMGDEQYIDALANYDDVQILYNEDEIINDESILHRSDHSIEDDVIIESNEAGNDHSDVEEIESISDTDDHPEDR